MKQVLFHDPIFGLPIFGYGMMLFVTFIITYWLVSRRADRAGVPRQYVQDFAVWIFIGGLIGARIFWMVFENGLTFSTLFRVETIETFFSIWNGGLVFYGSAFGGAIAFFAAYYLIIRKHNLSVRQLGDIMAPAVALGLSLGRIGCLLNGCCYGHVACPDCYAVHYPLSAPARFIMTERGYQTAAGFTIDELHDRTGRTVAAVEPGSAAQTEGGLRAGDMIVEVNGHPIHHYDDLFTYLVKDWERGRTDLELAVERGGQTVTLPVFYPRTLGLHPTQLYETISAALIFLLLLAYEPFKRRNGELLALLMLCYSVHRFIDESLRDDTAKFADGLTLSQNISILLFAAGLVLWIWLRRQPAAAVPAQEEPAPSLTGTV